MAIVVDKEADQTANTIVGENVVNMLTRFTGNPANAIWYVNQDCLSQLPFLTVNNVPIYVPGRSFDNASFGLLLGRPIIPVEHCETLGSKGDILLADFSQYLLISKGGTEVTPSIHVRFLSDETAFRFIVRNNGQPLVDEPITPLKGTKTLSPFVMLTARP